MAFGLQLKVDGCPAGTVTAILPLLIPQLGLVRLTEKETGFCRLTEAEAVAEQLLASNTVTVYVVLIMGETVIAAVLLPLLQA